MCIGTTRCAWNVYWYNKACLKCVLVQQGVPEMCIGTTRRAWNMYWYNKACLKCVLVLQGVSEMCVGTTRCVWNVCWYYRVCLKCVLVLQGVSEMCVGTTRCVWNATPRRTEHVVFVKPCVSFFFVANKLVITLKIWKLTVASRTAVMSGYSETAYLYKW